MLMGDFLKDKNADLFWFHEISIVFNYEGLDVVFTVYLLFFGRGVKFLLLFGFLGHNLGCMPWIFPLAGYK